MIKKIKKLLFSKACKERNHADPVQQSLYCRSYDRTSAGSYSCDGN